MRLPYALRRRWALEVYNDEYGIGPKRIRLFTHREAQSLLAHGRRHAEERGLDVQHRITRLDPDTRSWRNHP